jgi:hypothetical protein
MEINLIDAEWEQFLNDNGNARNARNETNETKNYDYQSNNYSDNHNKSIHAIDAPEPTDIYISTKSKIAYLNTPIDLNIFWNIPVISYTHPTNGVLKKQMKFVSLTKEEVSFIQENLIKELYYEEYIISHVDNPNGRIKYKDVRKISIGISKKDIMSCRIKKKQAFYNCFVMIFRLQIDNIYKEFHIKIFNTGKIEIPGIQNDYSYNIVLKYIIDVLQPHINDKLEYISTSDTVLINSNFNCGYQINREMFFEILKYKYKFHAIYDPCSYPGIQCKFYYDKTTNKQNGILQTKIDNTTYVFEKCKGNKINEQKSTNIIEVSFMIFRTGSVLIVGMCEEYVLKDIYELLKEIFKNEFNQICYKIIDKNALIKDKDRKKKIRKRVIYVSQNDN